MNRHDPCKACGRFLPDASLRKGEDGQGYCEGFDRPAHSTDAPCVLFVERGSRADRQSRQHRVKETISRASASQR